MSLFLTNNRPNYQWKTTIIEKDGGCRTNSVRFWFQLCSIGTITFFFVYNVLFRNEIEHLKLYIWMENKEAPKTPITCLQQYYPSIQKAIIKFLWPSLLLQYRPSFNVSSTTTAQSLERVGPRSGKRWPDPPLDLKSMLSWLKKAREVFSFMC